MNKTKRRIHEEKLEIMGSVCEMMVLFPGLKDLDSSRNKLKRDIKIGSGLAHRLTNWDHDHTNLP